MTTDPTTLTRPTTRKDRRRRWTPEMDVALLAAWRDRTAIDALADRLGTSRQACIMRASRIGYAKVHPRREWPPDQDDVLTQLYGLVPTTRLATMLGRTPVGVIKRAKRLNLDQKSNRQRQIEVLLARPATPATDTAELDRLRVLLAYRVGVLSAADACTALECSAGQLLRACQTEATAGYRVATEKGRA